MTDKPTTQTTARRPNMAMRRAVRRAEKMANRQKCKDTAARLKFQKVVTDGR